jgi:serine/threonine-protein kinase ULK/ATG1
MKYYLYFLFERNTAFFFNFVMQKIITLGKMKQLNFTEDNYFRLIYVIMKNQIIHLERVSSQLQTKKPEKFDMESWGRF